MNSNETEPTRIPWKDYLKSQIYKIIGFIFVAILIVGVMIVSQDIDLATATIDQPSYLIAIILSSICFFLVIIGFSKIVLFDMASEFGLRDEETNQMVYNARFFLFASLALSFCSAIYLLLDVFLYQQPPGLNIRPTYLELLPVLAMEWLLTVTEAEIPGLTRDPNLLGTGNEFYQTVRNIYFGFFFLVIVIFSVLVFLSILTSLARKRVVSRFQKEEKEEIDELEENRRLYKVLIWLGIPFIVFFIMLAIVNSPITGPILIILAVIILGLLIWWFYQLAKVIFLMLWRGAKITAFITSVNFLIIIPLIGILYLLPVISWTVYDIYIYSIDNINFDIQTILFGGEINQVRKIGRVYDILSILQLDFVFITVIATFIVGFAEGFAIVAIFTAISRGTEVARTGSIISRSPPKIAVVTKYLVMLSLWLGLLWNSLRSIIEMLTEELSITLPSFLVDLLNIPSLVYLIYDNVILPLSEWLESLLPVFRFIPFLLLPLYFILAGAFKFLSVTIITPRVKERLSIFFLLISTAFVLIITNILGDIYELGHGNPTQFQDAPLLSYNLAGILESVVEVFEYVESLAFYFGFLFGIVWVTQKFIKSRHPDTVTYQPKEKTIQSTGPSSPLHDKVPEETNKSSDPSVPPVQKSQDFQP